MKHQFVKTSMYKAFRSAIADVETRGAAEAGFCLVTGEAALGKTANVTQWAIEKGAVFMRAKVEWTPNYFYTELADTLKVDARGKSKERFGRLVAYLAKHRTPLVIDEVEHTLNNGAKVLEAIRDLSDLTEIIVVMVGMDQAQAKLARHLQLASRVARVVNFGKATLEDTALVCAELCEVKIEADLVAEAHRQTSGRMRELMNAIATIERAAKRNGLASIGVKDMQGQALTHDWQARRGRLVQSQAGAVLRSV